MLYSDDERAARWLLRRLREVEAMQKYKMLILRAAEACEESASVVGAFVDALIVEFQRGDPTTDEIETLRLLNQAHGQISIAVIQLRVKVSGIYETMEKWIQSEQRERRRRQVQMRAAMEEVLEIAIEAKRLHGIGEALEQKITARQGARASHE